jgi:hypothetical protein
VLFLAKKNRFACVHVRACVRVHACVRACVRVHACVCVRAGVSMRVSDAPCRQEHSTWRISSAASHTRCVCVHLSRSRSFFTPFFLGLSVHRVIVYESGTLSVSGPHA